MEKIRIFNLCWFLMVYTIVCVLGKTEVSTSTLCVHLGQGDTSAGCLNDEKIILKKLTYGESLCQDVSISDICHSNISTYFNNYCLGNNNCTLSTKSLFNNNCQRPPRRLFVTFKCNWWFLSWTHTVHTCANSLKEVNCPPLQHIHITNVVSYSGCDNINTQSAITRLMTLCDDKRRCSPDTYRNSSLFHNRFISVSYLCKESTDFPVTDSTQSTSSENELDMTTISAAYVTDKRGMLPKLTFDNESRIEITHDTLVNKVYLCSYEWDNHDARVLCKTLNKSWTGYAKIEDKLLELDTAPYSVHCGGLETSLFDCNYTIDQQGCNITTVAGAVCCQGTGRPGECLTNASTMISSLTQDSTTIGVAVGIPLALIALVGFIIAIVFIRRRYIRSNSDKQISNSRRKNADDNYIGQQGISLPKYPSNNRILYNQATNSTHAQGIEGGREYSHPSKDAQSLYALSEEGVYDKANEKRHVVNDTVVYSRAIDTMYDSTDQHNRQERKEGTYDHVFGQRTEDHYDITTRT